MKSMGPGGKRSQAVPDDKRGVVVGIDVSRGWFDYGAFSRRERAEVERAKQEAGGFGQLERYLRELVGRGREVWVAFEPTGPYSTCLCAWLLGGPWRVVQVNPYHVKRTREVRDNRPGSSDRKSCGVIADLIWQGCYQQVKRLEGAYAQLRALAGEWEALTRKHTALGNEFQSLLASWFPELSLGVFSDALCKSVRAVVRHYESPQGVMAGGLGELRAVLKAATRMGRYTAAIWEAAAGSIGVREASRERQGEMVALLDLVEVIEGRQRAVAGEMGKVVGQAAEGPSLLSIPNWGVVSVGTLLGECGPLGDYPSYHHLERHLGLDLCQVNSGQQRGRVRLSRRGRARARHLLHERGVAQLKVGGLFYEYAQEQRGKKKPGEICTAVSRKLLRLVYALGRDRSRFDRERWYGSKTEHGQRPT